MLSVTYKPFMPRVIMLNVVMLSVAAPLAEGRNLCLFFNYFRAYSSLGMCFAHKNGC
jgi:hypothetical protein